MNPRLASTQEISDWNKLILNNPDQGNILQATAFAETKAGIGWKTRHLVVEGVYITALERTIPLWGKFWYLPKGPGVTSPQELKKILKGLKEIGRQEKINFLRLEPEILATPKNLTALKNLGLIVKPGVQVPNTVLIDITPEIDQIIASFSSKTRYNIRSAQKHPIIIKQMPINQQTSKEFYQLMTGTFEGRAFLRPKKYLQQYWQNHAKNGTGYFFFAWHDNQLASTDFITILGNKATRKDAASTRQRTIRGVSALLELEVIKFLKEQQVTTYDLCGCPPADKIKDSTHPYFGIGVFKTGFNEQVTDFVGALDLVLSPQKYNLWQKYLEKIVKKLYFYLKRDLYF